MIEIAATEFQVGGRLEARLGTLDGTHIAAGGEYTVTQSSINSLLTNPDRTLRRTAYENYADAHLANRNTLASCLSTGTDIRFVLMSAEDDYRKLARTSCPGIPFLRKPIAPDRLMSTVLSSATLPS